MDTKTTTERRRVKLFSAVVLLWLVVCFLCSVEQTELAGKEGTINQIFSTALTRTIHTAFR